ncbi:MAG TPA: leucine-rich repeat domain-containing protein [Verrucomicrobiae bacterium]
MKQCCLLIWFFFLAFTTEAQFTFITNNGAIIITGYKGSSAVVEVPGSTNGCPVAAVGNSAFAYLPISSVVLPDSVGSIGDYAFAGCLDLTNITFGNQLGSIGKFAFDNCYNVSSVTFPGSLANLGEEAFANCSGLRGAYFQGNAPAADATVFLYDTVTVYYLPAMTGWGATFGGAPTAYWTLSQPLILMSSAQTSVQTNGFGFTVSWATNQSLVVDATASVASSLWQPVQTNSLTNGVFYFRDAQWSNHPSRFYRVRSP